MTENGSTVIGNGSTVLQAQGVRKEYVLRAGLLTQLVSARRETVRAVDGVDLALRRGEVLALVGESGSGKTTLGRLLTLLEMPTAGSVVYAGRPVTGLGRREVRRFRREVQMIFQNPYESLDPRLTVEASVDEPLRVHGIGSPRTRRELCEAMLSAVELRPPAQFLSRYPHELSGGQRQRVAIARAMVLQPRLIVADEPVSMLDVSVRSGIMNLMLDLRARFEMTYLFITHDLAVARYMGDRIAVMYLGVLVEEGPMEEVLAAPAHPYTRLLIQAVPRPHPGTRRQRVRLAGEAAAVREIPSGCRFHPRCPLAQPICAEREPPPVTVGPGRWAACHFAAQVAAHTGPGFPAVKPPA